MNGPQTDFALSEIGYTPLLRIRKLAPKTDKIRVYAKAEWFNPGGSIKDRAAAGMIAAALADGRLTAGKTILDASSGNTGIALAWIGARLGFPVKLAVPQTINRERERILRAYGAELELTDPLQGSDGAILKARELYQSDPKRFFYCDQYSNDENWRAHYKTTAPEIWEQTERAVTHFVAGLGTSGTFRGTATRLRELNPRVRLIALQPDSPLHGLEGLKHMPTSIVPPIYDSALADETVLMPTDAAYAAVRRAAREEGLLLGVSSGANLAAALRIAAELDEAGRSAVIVTVLPDGGERYLGEKFWREP